MVAGATARETGSSRRTGSAGTCGLLLLALLALVVVVVLVLVLLTRFMRWCWLPGLLYPTVLYCCAVRYVLCFTVLYRPGSEDPTVGYRGVGWVLVGFFLLPPQRLRL